MRRTPSSGNLLAIGNCAEPARPREEKERMVEKVRARFEVLDERFAGVGGDEWMERVFDGGRWTEGPAYVPAGRYLVFSDIPNDRVLRWDETTGAVGVLRAPADYANGRTLDRLGRLVSCEHGTRRVTRVEHDGSLTVLADRYRGSRFNSPNDVVEHSDGSIWFTDPSYGIDSDYEGIRALSELDGCHVYRIDPRGEVHRVADDFDRPNGLAFGAGEDILYVGDSRRKHIRRFGVAGGALSGGEVFATCDAGTFDGLRLDADGRLWAAADDGLHCFAPDGTLLGKLLVPEVTSNLVFGGPRRNHLFITATTSVYAIRLKINGAAYPG
jgi:gluconolactonase